MKLNRRIFLAGVLVALTLHCLGIWVEAACGAAGIGFAEKVEWGRLAGGFGQVTWERVRQIGLEPWEWLSLQGMVLALLAVTIGMEKVSKWVLLGYFGVLMAAGGWIGIWLSSGIVYFPLLIAFGSSRITGEFFDEGIARLVMAGAWPTLVLILTLAAFITRRPLWLRSKIPVRK